MHFPIYLLLLVLAVQAAPGRKRPLSPSGELPAQKNAKPTLLEVQPKPNALASKLTVIDESCRQTPGRLVEIERALSDAYDIALVGQSIKPGDDALTDYFILPHAPSAKKVTRNDAESKAVKEYLAAVLVSAPERKAEKLVPSMATSIITGGGIDRKITVSCPSPEICGDRYAFVMNLESTINLCPQFFSKKSAVSHASKSFNLAGWCAPPYLLSNFLTGAEIILHEMTHFVYIATHALILSELAEGEKFDASKTVPWHWFTQDSHGHADENDANNEGTYSIPIERSARLLAERWIAYFAYLTKPDKAKAHLNPPPLGTADNAESYALALVEYYFYVKCKAYNFDPKKITR